MFEILAEAQDDLVNIVDWPQNRFECKIVVAHLLQGIGMTPEIDDKVKSGEMILLVHGCISEQAFEKYSARTKSLINADEYLLKVGVTKCTREIGNLKKSVAWGFVGTVMLAMAKTQNADSCLTRIQNAFKQAGLSVPGVINKWYNYMSTMGRQVDMIETYHSALWSNADFIVSQMKDFLSFNATDSLGSYMVAQIKMTWSYSQMTFIRNIKDYMSSGHTSARVLKSVVNEYRSLLDALKAIKQNTAVAEEHFKLFRVPGCETIDAPRYPQLSAIVFCLLEGAQAGTTKPFKLKVHPNTLSVIRSAMSLPLPAQFTDGASDSLTDEDLKLIGLSRRSI